MLLVVKPMAVHNYGAAEGVHLTGNLSDGTCGGMRSSRANLQTHPVAAERWRAVKPKRQPRIIGVMTECCSGGAAARHWLLPTRRRRMLVLQLVMSATAKSSSTARISC